MRDGIEQRYHVTGDIDVMCPPALQFRLEDIDLVKRGSFRDPEGPLEVSFGSSLGELRKLALASDPLHQLVLEHEEEPDDRPAVLRLRAPPPLLRRMASAARRFPDEPTPEQLVGSQAWLRAALSFDEYEPVRLDLVEGAPAWRAEA